MNHFLEVVTRPKLEASLQITSTSGVGGALTSNVVAAIIVGDQGDTLEGYEGTSEDDNIFLNYLEHVICARVGC
jgi:hypothetical protein